MVGPMARSKMFYLQGIRNIRPFVAPAWTLCLKVQFYLVYVAVLWLVARVSTQKWPVVARFFERRESLFLLICVAISTTILFGISTFPVAWIPIWLPQFGPGVAAFVAYKSVRDKQRLPPMSWGLVAASVLIPLIAGIRHHLEAYTASGIVGALLLVLVMRSRLDLGRSSTVIRYFGSRSYSLYLIHGLAMANAMPIVSKIDSGTPATQFGVFALSIAVAVASAELLFRFVEQPVLQFSRSISYNASIPNTLIASMSRVFRGFAEPKDRDSLRAKTNRLVSRLSNRDSNLTD